MIRNCPACGTLVELVELVAAAAENNPTVTGRPVNTGDRIRVCPCCGATVTARTPPAPPSASSSTTSTRPRPKRPSSSSSKRKSTSKRKG